MTRMPRIQDDSRTNSCHSPPILMNANERRAVRQFADNCSVLHTAGFFARREDYQTGQRTVKPRMNRMTRIRRNGAADSTRIEKCFMTVPVPSIVYSSHSTYSWFVRFLVPAKGRAAQ